MKYKIFLLIIFVPFSIIFCNQTAFKNKAAVENDKVIVLGLNWMGIIFI